METETDKDVCIISPGGRRKPGNENEAAESVNTGDCGLSILFPYFLYVMTVVFDKGFPII